MPDQTDHEDVRNIPPAITEKIHVDSLRVRDKVILRTAKSTYVLTVGKNSHCILSAANIPAKVAQIILRGGTNADATEYTPNRIYVGGRLAYAFDEESTDMMTTSQIESLSYEPATR
ncbi:MAG: hypothetical protein IAE94_12275 [Chthoniobacterales bacterium]|nr:hypothetical protein [Chthoniobacterales bacterium]